MTRSEMFNILRRSAYKRRAYRSANNWNLWFSPSTKLRIYIEDDGELVPLKPRRLFHDRVEGVTDDGWGSEFCVDLADVKFVEGTNEHA